MNIYCSLTPNLGNLNNVSKQQGVLKITGVTKSRNDFWFNQPAERKSVSVWVAISVCVCIFMDSLPRQLSGQHTKDRLNLWPTSCSSLRSKPDRLDVLPDGNNRGGDSYYSLYQPVKLICAMTTCRILTDHASVPPHTPSLALCEFTLNNKAKSSQYHVAGPAQSPSLSLEPKWGRTLQLSSS